MRLLLDTHLILWWMSDSPLLPGEAEALIGESSNIVFVSAVSLWEIWLKRSLGKLRLPSRFEDQLSLERFESLPLAASHTRLVADLPWHHRDPFDRMLIAQAKAEGLRLLTADHALARYGSAIHVCR